MNIEPHRITVGGLRVDVVRKNIKNLHLGVYPPQGRVRVAAPLSVSDDAVRLAVVNRLAWIKRQRAKFEAVLPHREMLPVGRTWDRSYSGRAKPDHYQPVAVDVEFREIKPSEEKAPPRKRDPMRLIKG